MTHGMKRGGRDTFNLPAATPPFTPTAPRDLINVSWKRPVAYRLKLTVRITRSPVGTGLSEVLLWLVNFAITDGVEEAAQQTLVQLASPADVGGSESVLVIEGVASQLLVSATVESDKGTTSAWDVLASAVVATFGDATQERESEAF